MAIMSETYRTFDKMVEFYNELYYTDFDLPYTVQGRPSPIECTNLTLLVGKHSYYIGATKDKATIYELGIKTFPNLLIDLDDIKLVEYTRESIMIHYGNNELYLDLIDSNKSCLN